MKRLIGMVAVLLLVACSQESVKQTKPVASVEPAVPQATMEMDAAKAHADMLEEAEPTAADAAQAHANMLAEDGPTADTSPAPAEVVVAKKEVVKPQPAAVTPQVSKPAVTKAEPVVTKPVAQTQVVETKVAEKKVVAPLVQGKQPIKSEPSPAPSDIMLKSEPSMDMAKANALTKKCKSCHATDKDKVGPSWKNIQAAYGSADTLAAVFASGFNVEDRKVAATDAKFKKKAKVMTGQYKSLIKKQVEKGKFTYNEMAQAIFAK